jgi:hypothetical protein
LQTDLVVIDGGVNDISVETILVLAIAAPVMPTEVFRLSAACATHTCPHFDGTDCRLATRKVKMKRPAVVALPPCLMRKDCRRFSQEVARLGISEHTVKSHIKSSS